MSIWQRIACTRKTFTNGNTYIYIEGYRWPVKGLRNIAVWDGEKWHQPDEYDMIDMDAVMRWVDAMVARSFYKEIYG